MGDPHVTEAPACKHLRTQLIAKDQDSEYVECLDCGAILEASEQSGRPQQEPTNVDDSLSDA